MTSEYIILKLHVKKEKIKERPVTFFEVLDEASIIGEFLRGGPFTTRKLLKLDCKFALFLKFASKIPCGLRSNKNHRSYLPSQSFIRMRIRSSNILGASTQIRTRDWRTLCHSTGTSAILYPVFLAMYRN